MKVASQLLGWDHVEMWVGNARAAAAWLCSGYGFSVTGYSGPETGVDNRVSWTLEQGDIRLVVTAGLDPASEVARHVLRHGDGVRDLAFRVLDADEATGLAEKHGASVVADHTIAAYGDTRIVFVDHDNSQAAGMTTRLPGPFEGPAVGLLNIDHLVGNVEDMDQWVSWFEEVLGFTQMMHFSSEQISTQYSALRSTVLQAAGGIVMPINEPAPGLRKSQITEYLEAYGGPGVQHIAFGTADIVGAVSAMRRRGVRFLDMPPAYYEESRARLSGFDLPWETLERLGIEADTDSGGYLLQIFSETFGDRPTLFFETIQREGARGFGEGNFKALFEAIEREQARRGNL